MTYPFILIFIHSSSVTALWPSPAISFFSPPKRGHMQRVINSLTQSFHCFSPMKGALVQPSWSSQMNSSLVASITLKSRCDRMTLEDFCPVAQSHRKGSNINQHSNKSVWWIPNVLGSFLTFCCFSWMYTEINHWEKMPSRGHDPVRANGVLVNITVNRFNEDRFLYSGLTRATCNDFLFQRSKWENTN